LKPEIGFFPPVNLLASLFQKAHHPTGLPKVLMKVSEYVPAGGAAEVAKAGRSYTKRTVPV